GEAVDHRADLFSLGSVLYTMCTGQPPFWGASAFAALKRVTEDTPQPIAELAPETPSWLCDIIARLHAKKPSQRSGTAREVADLLARGKSEDATAAPRHPRRWAAAAALLLLVAGVGFTEGTGVTNFRGTVVRLFSPEGTLVVEVDDPGVSVQIDGSEL